MGVTASRTGEYSPDNATDPDLVHHPTDTSPHLRSHDPHADSSNNISNTEFVWSFGGDSVYIAGAWDDWHVKTAMSRTSPHDFTAVLALPIGTYQYKFIVDGNWKHSPAYSTGRDQHGNLNNVVVVKPQILEYDSNVLPFSDTYPNSPVESYDYSILPQEDHTTEPPTLPNLLASAPLDTLTDKRCNGTDFVRYNHIFSIRPDVPHRPSEIRTMASELRYKSKVITTILITAKNKAHSPIGLPTPFRPNRTHPISFPQQHDRSTVRPMGETQSLILDALNNV